MNGQGPGQRFQLKGREWLDTWNGEKLVSFSLPPGEESLRGADRLLAVRGNCIQPVVHIVSDPFSVRLLAREEPSGSRRPLSSLDPIEAEWLKRQAWELFGLAQQLDLPFLDWANISALPEGRIWIPLRVSAGSMPADKETLQRALTAHSSPTGGQPSAVPAAAARPDGAHPPTGSKPTLYRLPDFAASVIQSLAADGKRDNLKIYISATDSWQKELWLDTIYQYLHTPDSLLIRVDPARAPSQQGSELVPATGKAAVAGVEKFSRFLQKNAIERVTLLIDRIPGRHEAEYFRYLLGPAGIYGLTLLVFEPTSFLDFDLEINESPPDLLSGRLPPVELRPPALDEAMQHTLRLIQAAERPVPTDALTPVLNSIERSALRRLVAAAMVSKTPAGLVISPALASGLPPQPPGDRSSLYRRLAESWRDDGYALLASLADGKLDISPATMHRLLEQGVTEELLPAIGALAIERLGDLQAQNGFLESIIDLLILGGRLIETDRLLDGHPVRESAYVKLKRAELFRRRRDYQQMADQLLAIDGLPADRCDEYNFLHYVQQEKASRRVEADRHRKRLKSPFYSNLAAILHADRAIYSGEFVEAGRALEKARAFFAARHSPHEEIEARSQLAKLWREKGDFSRAETEYKELFLKSSSRDFTLLSAAVAVDLGNLYLQGGQDPQAEIWYLQALGLYTQEGNETGVMLSQANLFEIELNRGDWNRAEQLLQAVTDYNQTKGTAISLAVDLFNRAWLEYLRRNFSAARQYLSQAEERFQRHHHEKGLAECQLLLAKIAFYLRQPPSSPTAIRNLNSEPGSTWRLLAAAQDTSTSAEQQILRQQLASLAPTHNRFDLTLLFARRFRGSEWLSELQKLAAPLCAHGRHYFQAEYQSLRFELWPDEQTLPSALRGEFFDILAFFTRNRRRLPPALLHLQKRLEDEETREEIFHNARMVGDSTRWTVPEDVFRALRHELDRWLRLGWTRLFVWEGTEPRFDFAAPSTFPGLAAEICERHRRLAHPRVYDAADLRREFSSRDRVFFSCRRLLVLPWRISSELTGLLLLGVESETEPIDCAALVREVLTRFAALFTRWFENDFKVGDRLDFIVGHSAAIHDVKRRIAQVAKVDFSLLILGESGTGKELAARAVHLLSPRCGKPFIPVNSAAIPDNLLEAELFGYRKGAFTGAGENRIGLIESAEGGTLFLDEIADLPIPLQAKLLRALQESEIRRLGETRAIRVDIRVISATNRDLNEMVRNHQFRADLFYRLQDLTLRLPSLRERFEDLPLLIEHFFQKYGQPPPTAQQLQVIGDLFSDSRFEGNVRELESRIKHLITFGYESGIESTAEVAFGLKSARDVFERNLTLRVLEENRWNRTRTAEALKISRMALFQLMKRHGLQKGRK